MTVAMVVLPDDWAPRGMPSSEIRGHAAVGAFASALIDTVCVGLIE
jgi:hypothetical protein